MGRGPAKKKREDKDTGWKPVPREERKRGAGWKPVPTPLQKAMEEDATAWIGGMYRPRPDYPVKLEAPRAANASPDQPAEPSPPR